MRAGEAGNEKGYVVKMTDDTLSTPYKIMPGTRVRLESAYDGTERRTGVMGCAPRAVTVFSSLGDDGPGAKKNTVSLCAFCKRVSALRHMHAMSTSRRILLMTPMT